MHTAERLADVELQLRGVLVREHAMAVEDTVEHGFAHLKNWRILTKLRTAPARATGLLPALFVLTNLEGIR
ncbi:hypothetical protein AB0B50_01610 [Streptomyces sp. NPDC041068]|uniref:hypothetical protein n=1 Tax=Streptomyces sp. NPDC041068 TaxID=3155130 RepID=UPI0033CD5344